MPLEERIAMKAVPAYARSRGYKPGQFLSITITIALSSILGLIAACLQVHIISAYEFRVYVSTDSSSQRNTIQSSSSQELIWSDEFNGLAGKKPDASKWSPDVGGSGWGNNQR